MHAFAELYAALDETTRTNEKVAALAMYFASAPPADAAWALARSPIATARVPEANANNPTPIELFPLAVAAVPTAIALPPIARVTEPIVPSCRTVPPDAPMAMFPLVWAIVFRVDA